jgi:hypothetical protein
METQITAALVDQRYTRAIEELDLFIKELISLKEYAADNRIQFVTSEISGLTELLQDSLTESEFAAAYYQAGI